ncbi:MULTISPECIES: FAD-binding oxidoreductase [Enorma]|uniref:FAD-binding oxidoreductase n=1 Tax=Enorma TaxID=1472762 RepID=UPI00034D3F9E|nr:MULTISPECIES: FAD-binding oxidoreductase [Enorma]
MHIQPWSVEFDDFLHDESRNRGHAETISFPRTEEDVRAVVRELYAGAVPITVQGARTGLAAGAVPQGGHVLNLSRMNRCLGLRQDERGRFFVRVQPGLVLSELRKYLAAKAIPADGWDAASLAYLAALAEAPEQMFPTDPTETSATLGGMAACNASGARSYRYGAMREHVTALRLVLADGDVLALRRGACCAHGRRLSITTEGGRRIDVALPRYEMPHAKNASGYFVADDMDAVDLVIGSDGTLGIITELELALLPAPDVTWGVSCFFAEESQAVAATIAARERMRHAAALEYFDPAALDVLRRARATGSAFAALPELPESFGCCLFVELQAASEEEAMEDVERLGRLVEEAGGDAGASWVARTAIDSETLRFFRHAVPESVNMLIDERRRTEPAITKLGSDMSVPNDRLADVMALYRSTLAEAGLEAAAWGHIGDNHLHVNILPRTSGEFAQGKELFRRWAHEVTAMGGAVSAEHGVGKIKRDFLEIMYGEEAIAQMARLKLAFDPAAQLGRGNLIPEQLLPAIGDSPQWRAKRDRRCADGLTCAAGEVRA